MAYIPFRTEKADYTFYGANHIYGRIDTAVFDGIDALVVEGRDDPKKPIPNRTWDESSLFVSLIGNKSLANKIREKNVSLFEVDVQGKDSLLDTIKELLSFPFLAIYLPIAITYSFSNSQLHQLPYKFFNCYERLNTSPTGRGRSVIAAEKIEEYVVPLLSKRIKDRRPRVGIIYGAGHQMIVEYLQSQELRKRVLAKYRKSDFKQFDKGKLDRVLRFEFDEDRGVWMPEEHRTGLFCK